LENDRNWNLFVKAISGVSTMTRIIFHRVGQEAYRNTLNFKDLPKSFINFSAKLYFQSSTERTNIDKLAKLFEVLDERWKEENYKNTTAQLLNEFETWGLTAPNS
jgi:hypothetical protein